MSTPLQVVVIGRVGGIDGVGSSKELIKYIHAITHYDDDVFDISRYIYKGK